MAFFAPDIAIDLGTTNTLVYVKGRGIVINEPTIVVTETSNRHNVRAVGDEAQYLLGRTNTAYTVTLPIRAGTISDFDMTEVLVRYFMRKAIGVNHVIRPKVLVSVPSTLPAVNRKAMEEAVTAAGAKRVWLVEKPYAAAIGTGLPVFQPTGSMVVDIGGGTTDVAVVSLGGLVVCRSIPVGGDKMDEAVANYLKRQSLLISAQTAEEVKIDLGSAMPTTETRRIRVRGRDAVTVSIAKDVEFSNQQCYEALREPCKTILSAVQWVLERTPPELAGDIMRTGIHLTGGGAGLFAIDRFIAAELGIPVLIAKEPMDCTITGLGYLTENIYLMDSIGKQHSIVAD